MRTVTINVEVRTNRMLLKLAVFAAVIGWLGAVNWLLARTFRMRIERGKWKRLPIEDIRSWNLQG